MFENIILLKSIEINASCEKVFDFISDVKNDTKWRPEVEKMDVKGEKCVGTEIIEYITIYRFFHIVTPTIIKVLDKPNKFVVETPESHPSWVECIRTVEKINAASCKFTVQLSFSLNNLKQVFPILLPKFIVVMWYTPKMMRYLKNLKRIIES